MIDTHTHIDGEEFDNDRGELIDRAKAVGIEKVIVPNVNIDSLATLRVLMRDYADFCVPFYGLHPEDVRADWRQQVDAIFQAANENGDMRGVGEIGLDLYWDNTYIIEQKQAFAYQIQYAIDHKLPMSIHVRNAYPELFEVFANFEPLALRGSLHCFSGSLDDARRVIETYPNMALGVNGTFTYKKSNLPEIFKAVVPLSRIVVETDAPYLSPVPFRGKRNEPAYVEKVVQRLAEVYETSFQQIDDITTQNARNFLL